MALIQAKDVDKFNVKLVETGNSQNFQLNSKSAVAPKHEDLTALAASIQEMFKNYLQFIRMSEVFLIFEILVERRFSHCFMRAWKINPNRETDESSSKTGGRSSRKS